VKKQELNAFNALSDAFEGTSLTLSLTKK